MAKTLYETSDPLVKKAWDEKLFRDAVKASYWSRFTGTDSDSAVQEKTDLKKDKGDKITFGIRTKLKGSGVTSRQPLEGNEEKLNTKDCSVTLEEYAHAVRDSGPLDRQRAMFSIDDESQMALKDWGSEKIDQLHFDAAFGSFSKVFYKTAAATLNAQTTMASALAALDATNSKLTPAFLSALRTWAITGGARQAIPIRPIKVDGGNYLVLVVHPDALYDLKVDTTWQQAMREAADRGKSNPLFKDAVAVWHNVVVHEHENCTIGTTAGAVPYSYGLLFGAQALSVAYGKRPGTVSKTFDYDREHGYGWSVIMGVAKNIFATGTAGANSDYGSVGVALARTNISGV